MEYKLEKEHVSAYLPHRLKLAETEFNGESELKQIQFQDGVCWVNNVDISVIKLILKPLSDLKKEVEKRNIKQPQDIFPEYKQFLQNYKEFKEKFAETEFGYFIQQNRITDEKVAQKMFDTLEIVAYLLRPVRFAIVKKKKEEKKEERRLIQEIMAKIHRHFDLPMTSLHAERFNAATDKEAMIIFAQASAYESVLNQMMREVRAAYEAIAAL